MKNLFRVAVLLIFVTLTATMVSAANVIKIGGLFAMSGKASQVGIPTRNVAQMVVDDINRSGGINGSKLMLVVADTRSEPGQAVIALKKLISMDKVAAICGPTTTGEIMACIPTIEEAKIPVVACVGGAAPVVPVRPWVFKSRRRAVPRLHEFIFT